MVIGRAAEAFAVVCQTVRVAGAEGAVCEGGLTGPRVPGTQEVTRSVERR